MSLFDAGLVDGGYLRHEVMNGRASVEELAGRVRRRLVLSADFVALRAFDGLSADELAVLAERERAARPSELAEFDELAARRASGRATWRARWERMTEEEREAVRARNRDAYAVRRAAALAVDRHCASPTCAVRFVAEKNDRRFCSGRCRNREKMNRYRRRKRASRP